jgi:hypothetical protein
LTDRALELLRLKGVDSEGFVEIGLASADALKMRLQTEDGAGRPNAFSRKKQLISPRTDETIFGGIVTTLPKCIDAVRQGNSFDYVLCPRIL